MRSYEEALQRDPRCCAAHCGRGEMLRELSRRQEALLAYDELLRFDSQSASVLVGKGWVLIDLRRYEEALSVFDHALQFDSLDVLINYAGINIDKPLHEMTENDWDRVVDINMKGVFLCAQLASTYMQHQEHGSVILNIGAPTAIRGRTNGINYCASKAGVLVMTKCLALELAPKIRVNCIIPGAIRTGETEERFHWDEPEQLRAKEETIPLKRIGTPEDVAGVVSFLLSLEARYITGQKIIVDGGQLMW